MCGAQQSVAVSPRAAPWLAAVGGAVWTCACGLKVVSTGQCPETPPRCRRRPCLASRAPIPTAPSPVSEANHVAIRALCLCPRVPPPLSDRLRRREPLSEHPLAAFFSGYTCAWASSYSPPWRRTPPATRTPTSSENAAAVPVFPPFPLARSSGELPPPATCPAGGLSAVDARAPHLVPPPPR
jgi:hypothetical protein